MPAVLTKADMLTCAQGGTISPGGSKLEVAGQAVLTEAGVAGQTVEACKAANPPPLCTTVVSVSAGQAVKLVVGGAPALLDGMTASTDQPPPHVVGPVSASQTKLEAS